MRAPSPLVAEGRGEGQRVVAPHDRRPTVPAGIETLEIVRVGVLEQTMNTR
jgi:hypothetical protein